MHYKPRIAHVGALIGDTARAFMLSALMDNRPRTAGELALEAGVTPPTASAHLAKLTDAGLLKAESRGRYRYFRLASNEVASLLESIMVLGESRADGQAPRRQEPIRIARTCYDHLAGRLGVRIMEALESRGKVRVKGQRVEVTTSGESLFNELGISLENVRRRRRMFARTCHDWSEQRYHLGGALGAALAERLTKLGWIRQGKHSRAVTITREGTLGLRRVFGIEHAE